MKTAARRNVRATDLSSNAISAGDVAQSPGPRHELPPLLQKLKARNPLRRIDRRKEDDVWHQLHGDEVLRLLEADPRTGLPTEDVTRRAAKFGANRITQRPSMPAWLRFVLQFHQPLSYLLLVAVLVTAALGEWIDAAVILGVVLINAIVGFAQEAKATNAIEALSRMISSIVTVRRDGHALRINAHELVPGDVVLLEPGDRVGGGF